MGNNLMMAGVLIAGYAFAQPVPFRTTVLPIFPDGEFVTSAVADLDNDGRNELVAVNSARNLVRIARVSPSGGMTILREISLGSQPTMFWQYLSVQILDMNADGRKDIVFYHRANNTRGVLFLLEQDAAGNFALSSYPTPESDAAYSMAVADLNSDGLLDVVTANHGVTAAANLFVLYNAPTPAARFTSSANIPSTSSRVVHVYSADLNRDGRPDVIATTHPFGSFGALLLYNSPAGLAAPVLLAGPQRTMTAGFGDLNGDGQLDVVTTDGVPGSFSSNFQLYRRNAGAYAGPQSFPGSEPRSPRIADFNGDGVMDLVIDHASTHQIAIYFGDPQTRDILPQTPLIIAGGDLDTDHGERSVTDQLQAADVDNDGATDILFSQNRVVLIHRGDTKAPLITELSLAPNPAAVGAPVTAFARADDSTTGGSNIVAMQIRLDGGPLVAMTPADGLFNSPIESATAYLGGLTTGLHTVCVLAMDAAGQTSAEVCSRLPVFDPTAGFVTGGGRVYSPAGAYLAGPNLAGPAEFGFVAKYLPGRTQPTGEFEFEFRPAALLFRSSSMAWLVVTGGDRAVYRGSGVLNGRATCEYEVDAWDKSFGVSRVDALGLRIFNCSDGGSAYELPPAPLLSGSIVVH